MANALLMETRSERLDLGLPMLAQLRVSPTVLEVLQAAKPDSQGWPAFALESMLIRALLPDTLGLRLRELNRRVVRIVGHEDPTEPPAPDSRQADQNDLTTVRKPVQMSLKTALVAAGKRNRS